MNVPSAAFLEALRKSHKPVARVTIEENGVEVANSITTPGFRLLSGSWKAVRQADVRRSATVTFVDKDRALIPYDADDLLDPLARREMRLSRGIQFRDGTIEWVDVFVGPLETVEITEDDKGGITITCSGRDRSVRVAGARITTPYTIATGTNIGTAVRAIVEDGVGVGTFPLNFAPTDEVTTGPVTYDSSMNRWVDGAQALAAGIGYELAFDGEGVLGFQPVPDVDGQVAWDLNGAEPVLLRGTSRSIDFTNPVNVVRVKVDAPWLLFPIVGEASDDDPDSPTYTGRIGEWVEEVTDATVFTQEAADAAAAARLRMRLGVEEQVAWKSLPNPALDVAQVISLGDDVTGGVIRAVVETIDGDLLLAPMTGTTRRRRTG